MICDWPACTQSSTLLQSSLIQIHCLHQRLEEGLVSSFVRRVESAFASFATAIASAIVATATVAATTDREASTARSHSSPHLLHLPSRLSHHLALHLHCHSLSLAVAAFVGFA